MGAGLALCNSNPAKSSMSVRPRRLVARSTIRHDSMNDRGDAMGWWAKLLGRNDAQEARPPLEPPDFGKRGATSAHAADAQVSVARGHAVTLRRSKDWLYVDGDMLLGRQVSPDRHWTAAYTTAQAHQVDEGCYQAMLVDEVSGRAYARVRGFERVMGAAASDSGVLAVHHDLGPAKPLGASLAFFDLDGEPLATRVYDRNLHSHGVSACGRFAWASIAGPPSFEILDVRSGASIYSGPLSSHGQDYRLIVDGAGCLSRILVFDRNLAHPVELDALGVVMDAAALMNQQLASDDAYTRVCAAEELLLGEHNMQDVERAFSAATHALQSPRNAAEWTLARAHLVRGDALVLQGRFDAAIAEFELAASRDPKTAVKRRIASARKRMRAM